MNTIYLIYVHIIFISVALCMNNIQFEKIVNLPTDSDHGFFYLKKTDFPPTSNIFIHFRITQGKMDSTILYANTEERPTQAEPILPYKKDMYKMVINNETTTYIFEIHISTYNYYIISYTGFSGSSLKVACSSNTDKATYLPKGKIDIPNPSKFGFIYLKYEDFPSSDDFCVNFKISNGHMAYNIQYKETDIDPNFIIAFASARNKSREIYINDYGYCFPKANYEYLIIYYSSLVGNSLTLSSSTRIKHIPRKTIKELATNIDQGFIYLNYGDFDIYENIYLFFKIPKGSMNKYIQYNKTDSLPFIEEENYSFSDITIDKYSNESFYGFELPSKKLSDYKYLLIKYKGFTGSSLSVYASTKITYLSKDSRITFSNRDYDRFYLKYKDFLFSEDKNYFYLYFMVRKGEMNTRISYVNTKIQPLYEEQFLLTKSKSCGNPIIENNFKKYLFPIEKLNYIYDYIVIEFSGFNGIDIIIDSLSINPIASYLPKEGNIILPNDSKSGYVYIKSEEFQEDIYIYFDIINGKMDSNISYFEDSLDPYYQRYYPSFFSEEKFCDKKIEKKEHKYYSYKLSKKRKLDYIVILYSGYTGESIKVLSSIEDPFPINLVLIFGIIAGVIILAVVVVVIVLCLRNRKKRTSVIEEIMQPVNSGNKNKMISTDFQNSIN